MKRIAIFLILSLSVLVKMNADYKFIMPEIPTQLKTPRERADFLILNFWQNQNFSNLLSDRDAEEFEQNFVDFINLFPHANDSILPSGVNNFLSQLSTNKKNYILGIDLAEKYLFETDSPFYDEEYFILFIDGIMKSDLLSEKEKIRPSFMLEEAMKNRKGELATDFVFEDTKGEKHYLSETQKAVKTLLLFFDPDCDHCKDVITQLENNPKISSSIENGSLKVIAVYSGEEKDLWQKYALTLPNKWTIGYDTMTIYDEELYVLREMPTIYLLDDSQRILGKNLSLEKLYGMLFSE